MNITAAFFERAVMFGGLSGMIGSARAGVARIFYRCVEFRLIEVAARPGLAGAMRAFKMSEIAHTVLDSTVAPRNSATKSI